MHKKSDIENVVNSNLTDKAKIDLLCKSLEEKHSECLQLKTQLDIKNKEFDSFSYSIGHDLNAPLTHIIGFLGLLEERLSGKLDEKSQDFFKKVSDAAKKLGLMIAELMKLSRINRTVINLNIINLNDIVNETLLELKPMFPNRNIEWKLKLLPEIKADRELIKQVFTDLLHNALKFTQLCNTAIIEIGSNLSNDNFHAIYIKDNGIGFDNQYAEQIFGVFQQLRKEDMFTGIGMGLARVACIIHKHQGKISVHSELGAGATFTCFLP